jgi:hypothetical protein
MFCVFFVFVLDCKVIDDKCKAYGCGFVFPETIYDFALVVSIFCQSFFEEFLGNDCCLR